MMTSHDRQSLFDTNYRAWFEDTRRRHALLDAMAAQLADDADTRETYGEFAARIARETPGNLVALGVDLAHTRWRDALVYLHALQDVMLAQQQRAAWNILGLVLIAEIWALRGAPGHAPTLPDITEAKLQLAADWQLVADRLMPDVARIIRVAQTAHAVRIVRAS